MAYSRFYSRARKRRSLRGSLIAESSATLYLLFLFLFFPLLDLGAMGLRMFFLWYACNQSAMAGSKGAKWSLGNVGGTTNYANSIKTQATTTAANVVAAFSGVSINSGYPQLNVILQAIQHSDTTNNQPSAATVTYPNGAGLPLAAPIDSSQYVALLQVQIVGQVQPFIQVPFINNVPGLSAPFTVKLSSTQQIEDPNSLTY